MSCPPRKLSLLLTVALCAALAGCANGRPAPASLYEQLGGAPMMSTIASRVIEGFASSPDGHRAFDRVKLPRVKRGLEAFLCVVAHGPCVYDGDDMQRVHAGLKISEREFNALVEHLRETLDDLGVAPGAKNELLRRLAPMRREIVTASWAHEGHG